MFDRIRTWLVLWLMKTPVLIAGGVVVSYLLFAYLAVPPLAKWGAEKYIRDKTGYGLTVDEVRFDPLRLSLTVVNLKLSEPEGRPLLAFDSLFVDIEAESLFKFAYVFKDIRLSAPRVRVELGANGRPNWVGFIDALGGEEGKRVEARKEAGLPRVVVENITVQKGVLDFVDHKVTGGFETRFEPINLELHELSTLPDDKGAYTLSMRTEMGARIRWKGAFSLNPILAQGELRIDELQLARLMPYLAGTVPMDLSRGVAGLGVAYRAGYRDKRLSLNLDKAEAGIEGLAARLIDIGLAQPLAVGVGRLKLGLKLAAQLDSGPMRATVEDVAVSLSDLDLAAPASHTPLLRLRGLNIRGGHVDVATRQAGVAGVVLEGGEIDVLRRPDGQIPLLVALKSNSSQPKVARTRTDKLSAGPISEPWKYRVDILALKGWKIAVRDETPSPAAHVELINLNADIAGFDQDSLKDGKATLPVNLDVQVKSGGRFEAKGTVTPARPAADLNLRLTALVLRPAQPYLSQLANLDLAGGNVTTTGRLRIDAKAAAPLAYRGSFSINHLLLNEAGSQNRFLAWKSVSSRDLNVTPQAVQIGTLKIDGIDAKMIIDTNKTTNISKIVKAPTGPAAPTASAAATKMAQAGNEGAAPFRIDVDRVRISSGEMDFADYSLSLPFATRIHGLKGHVSNISSRPGGAVAELEIEGLVDDYGLARAAGQLNVFDPAGYMNIKTVFRNVEMTRLTPYSATFAGRRINSGKLSLDLEYKISNRQLQGENQVIMDRIVLGERVESPTARNLPLDLAIAILSDSDGRIDLGLPVSGSLDDPHFSYGQIVWKAIVNVISKIVAAPFRALGKMLGISGEQLESIGFDPGSFNLLSPEKEKLKLVAQVLAKRPKLALTVSGTYDPVVDRARMKENQVRIAVASRLGIKHADEERAPPVSTANPKTRAVLEDMCAERLGKEACKTLKAHYYEANPERQNTMGKMLSSFSGLFGKPAPVSARQLEALKGADLHELIYRRLLDKEPVSDEVLVALATRRGQALFNELREVDGVSPDRLSLGKPEVVEKSGTSILAKLGLGVR